MIFGQRSKANKNEVKSFLLFASNDDFILLLWARRPIYQNKKSTGRKSESVKY